MNPFFQPDGAWRLATVVTFLVAMAGVVWVLRQGVDALPPLAVYILGPSLFSLAIGYLLGLRSGRRQADRP